MQFPWYESLVLRKIECLTAWEGIEVGMCENLNDWACPQSTSNRLCSWLYYGDWHTIRETVSCSHNPVQVNYYCPATHVTVNASGAACNELPQLWNWHAAFSYYPPANLTWHGCCLRGGTSRPSNLHTPSCWWELAGKDLRQVGHTRRYLQCDTAKYSWLS